MNTRDFCLAICFVVCLTVGLAECEEHKMQSQVSSLDRKITEEERRVVLLNTCYPAPEHEFVDAAPACRSFSRLVQGEADRNERINP